MDNDKTVNLCVGLMLGLRRTCCLLYPTREVDLVRKYWELLNKDVHGLIFFRKVRRREPLKADMIDIFAL